MKQILFFISIILFSGCAPKLIIIDKDYVLPPFPDMTKEKIADVNKNGYRDDMEYLLNKYPEMNTREKQDLILETAQIHDHKRTDTYFFYKTFYQQELKIPKR
jgi:hypothetical protein